MRVGGVAEICPGSSFGALGADLLQHPLSTDAIEGIFEVDLQDPFVAAVDAVVVQEGIGRVNDGLCSSLDPNSKLKRTEVGGRICRRFLGDAFGRPTAECFANCNGAMPTRLLESSEEVAAREEGSDGGRRFPRSQSVDDARHGGKKCVAAIRSDGLAEVGSAGCRGASGRKGVEGEKRSVYLRGSEGVRCSGRSRKRRRSRRCRMKAGHVLMDLRGIKVKTPGNESLGGLAVLALLRQ